MHSYIIIVPYRDREQHLAQFLSHMQSNYPNIDICIVEQSPGKPFNRAKLLNVGYIENFIYDRFIFHDIDMLPIDVSYKIKPNAPVVQLAGSDIQLFDYLGGVTRYTRAGFARAGGYHNDYFHRAEDNEMMFNLKRIGMNVLRKPGKYKALEHKRNGPEFDPALWAKAQKPRAFQNQLAMCKYKIVDMALHDNARVKHIVVDV